MNSYKTNCPVCNDPMLKKCRKCYLREYAVKNKEKLASKWRRWRQKNKDKIKPQDPVWYKKYYEANKENINKKSRRYYSKNKPAVLLQHKEYLSDPKVREAHNKRRKERRLERRAVDLEFKLKITLRARTSTALRKNHISGSGVALLGCSIPELKKYLESKFQPGMTWENHGLYGWHLDHVIPLDSFNLLDKEQQLKAFHYTNLQPLWAKDNLKKKAIVPEVSVTSDTIGTLLQS